MILFVCLVSNQVATVPVSANPTIKSSSTSLMNIITFSTMSSPPSSTIKTKRSVFTKTKTSTTTSPSLLIIPTKTEEWGDLLAKMTKDRPCGSQEKYQTCTRCGTITGNNDAFYMCCINEDNIHQYCIDLVNHKIN